MDWTQPHIHTERDTERKNGQKSTFHLRYNLFAILRHTQVSLNVKRFSSHGALVPSCSKSHAIIKSFIMISINFDFFCCCFSITTHILSGEYSKVVANVCCNHCAISFLITSAPKLVISILDDDENQRMNDIVPFSSLSLW